MTRIRRSALPLIVVGWVACGLVAAGGLNAWYRENARELYQDPRWARQTWGFSVALGVLFGPLSLVLSGLFTGGWSDGWTLTMQPFPCTLNPQIWCGERRKP